MKKGFTLIELLAVIIILAVIALITTPVILNVVDEAKESSRISSVNSLLDATRLYMSEAMLDDSIDLSGNLLDIINNRVKGTKPNEGEIRIDGNDIGIAVKIDGYCYIKDYSDNEIIKTNDSDCVIYKVVEATCYGETEIIDTIEINYEGCVANFNSVFNEEYTEEELDKICKNEQYFWDGYYLKNYIIVDQFYGYDFNRYIDNNIIDVTYKKEECQTCFEYAEFPSQYEIDYDGCMNSIYKEYYSTEDLTKLCSGETIIDNGEEFNIKESIYDFSDIIWYYEIGIVKITELSGNAIITNYLCYEENELGLPTITDVVVPNKINGLKVTNVGSYAFANKNLSNITISNGIVNIYEGAFAYNKITSVKLPSSVTTIDNNAFSNNQITSVKLPSSVTELSGFDNNQISGELDLSNLTNLTTIDSYAFEDNQITSVKLPSSVTTIDYAAFEGNQIRGELDLSNLINLKEIETAAFKNNQITSVKLPSSVTTIDNNAFYGNQIEGELDLSNLMNLTTIDDFAFSNNQITSVKLPSSVTELSGFDNNQISGELDLSNLTNLTTIGFAAFRNSQIEGELDLSNLTNLTTIGEDAFRFNQITSVKIPNSVTIIHSSVFGSNSTLTLIEIDNIKDAISRSPWGAYKATIKWLRDSE